MSSDKVEKARQILRAKGAEKGVDLTRRARSAIEALKGQSSIAKEVSKDISMMSRAVMRNPKPEIVDKLNKARKKLAAFFANDADEGIQWMLSGSSEHARGGFKDVAAFRKFLNAEDDELSSSRLLTGMESALTAIGYRMVGAPEGKKPYDPATDPHATEAQKDMQVKLVDRIRYIGQDKTEANDQRTATTSSTYINRVPDCIWDNLEMADTDLTLGTEDVSEVSEAEDEEIKYPREVMAPRTFKQYNESPALETAPESEKLSWVGAAKKGNIPVRAHTSGTTSIMLGALAGICKTKLSAQEDPQQINCSDVVNNAENIKLMAGALAVSTFSRGDYHTPGETFAGVTHFIDQTVGSKEKKQLQPYEAFEGGFQLLEKSCSDEKVQGFDMSLAEAIKIVGEETMAKVENIEANLTEADVKRDLK